MNIWLDNAIREHKKEKPHVLVDCGYVNHQKARDNADLLLKHVGKKNLSIEGFGRILIRIPPKKIDILKEFQEITEGPGYSWTTHVFERNGEQFDLKYATH